MAKGQKTKAGHIIQMIWHGADPNRFNPNGKRVVCHNAEDYDFIEGIEFDKLSRKGAKALIANVPLEEMWTGKISGPLHYNLMDDQIFPFWIAKGTETPVTVGGLPCIDTEYVRPQLDRADRAFFSIEEGKAGGGADLGCYGMFTSFKWTSKRGNKGKSRFEVGFATQAAVPRPTLTGGTAQNHKTRVTASNVAGPVGLSVMVPGVAQAKAVNLAIGMTKAQIEAAFAAVALTAVATGTIATGAGKSQIISYSGNGPLSIGGVAVDLSAPESVNTLVGRIKSANPSRNTLTGTGTITKAVGAVIRVVGAGNSLLNQDYVPNGTSGGQSRFVAPNGSRIEYDATSGIYYLSVSTSSGGANNAAYRSFSGALDPAEKGWFVGGDESSQAPAPTVTAVNGNPGSANIILSDNASAGNVADLPVVGTGATTSGTAPGGAGGQIDLEFTAPGTSLLTVTKASGDAGYVLSTPQYGSDGSILQSMLPDDPIMPGHLFLYSADTPAGLEDESNLVGQIEEWEIDDSKICMPVSHHVRVNDPERPTLPATYNAHAEEESQEDGIKLSVTMDADEGSIVEGMKALLRASGSRLVSVPRYWRIAAIHPGSPRRVWIDFYGSVGASVPVKWAGSVEQYTFVYDLLENKTAPWNFKAKTRRAA